jgi:hypothetical protein
MFTDLIPKDLDEVQMLNLELLIDATSVNNVLRAISDFCHEKSLHILETSGDTSLYAHWRRAGCNIEAFQAKFNQRFVV